MRHVLDDIADSTHSWSSMSMQLRPLITQWAQQYYLHEICQLTLVVVLQSARFRRVKRGLDRLLTPVRASVRKPDGMASSSRM